jgi:predicted heme/steroid binding protein
MEPRGAQIRFGSIPIMLRRSLVLGLILTACSSSTETTPDGNSSSGTTPTPPDGFVGDVRESLTWEDGQKLAGVIRIVEGVTVTIAPGAKIQCNDATQIVIGGTLKVNAESNHAKISCAKWEGIITGVNGKIDANGLDLENARAAIKTASGSAESTIKNSKVMNCVRPFEVGKDTKLVLDHVEASVPTTVGSFEKSYTEVVGTLEAHYLKYNAQANEGLMAEDGGLVIVTDSELEAKGGQDLVSAYRGASMDVSYTTMKGAHCGVHSQLAKSIKVDHITSVENLFGVTIYGAESVSVTNSNLSGTIAWLDSQGDHGPATFENNFLAPTAAGGAPSAINDPAKTPPLVKDTRAEASIAAAVPRAK